MGRTAQAVVMLALCATGALGYIAKTEGTFEGLYRRDRWGDGSVAGFFVSPELHEKLKPYEGQYVRFKAREATQNISLEPATLYSIWSVTYAPEPPANLEIMAQLESEDLLPLTSFKINIRFTNRGTIPINLSSDGARVEVTGEAHDLRAIQRRLKNWWKRSSIYHSHTGTPLIVLCGYLKYGVVRSPTGTVHDLVLPPGDSLNLSLYMPYGLPVGKYQIEIRATSYSPGDNRSNVLSRAWLNFEIEHKEEDSQPFPGASSSKPNDGHAGNAQE